MLHMLLRTEWMVDFVRTDTPSSSVAAVSGADETGDAEAGTAASADTKPDNDVESSEPVPSDLCQDSTDIDTHQSTIGQSLLVSFVAMMLICYAFWSIIQVQETLKLLYRAVSSPASYWVGFLCCLIRLYW